MEIKKYILRKFDYNVNVSIKKFYTPDETLNQILGINVKFLKNRKNIKLNFKIDIIDGEEINISELKIEYLLTLDSELPEINNNIAKKIVAVFYPILNKVVSNFYSVNGLKNIKLPKF